MKNLSSVKSQFKMIIMVSIFHEPRLSRIEKLSPNMSKIPQLIQQSQTIKEIRHFRKCPITSIATLLFFFSVYRFIVPTLDKTEWPSTLDVKCGWNKEWDPPVADGCVDPRGCQPPPARNSEIWCQ
jgi:hypothetical protein